MPGEEVHQCHLIGKARGLGFFFNHTIGPPWRSIFPSHFFCHQGYIIPNEPGFLTSHLICDFFQTCPFFRIENPSNEATNSSSYFSEFRSSALNAIDSQNKFWTHHPLNCEPQRPGGRRQSIHLSKAFFRFYFFQII